MKPYTFQCIILFICSAITVGNAGFAVQSFEDCNPGFDYPFKLDTTFKMGKKKQFVDVDLMLPGPLDESSQLNVTIDALMNGDDNSIRLLSDTEKDICKTMHDYFGEFMLGIERKMKIEPGVCPIPKGTYHLHHYALNIDRVPLAKNLPVRNVRVTVEATNTKDNSIMFCKVAKVINNP